MSPLLHTILAFGFALGCFALGIWTEHRHAAKSRREMLALFDRAQAQRMADSAAYSRNAYRIGYKHGREGLESVL